MESRGNCAKAGGSGEYGCFQFMPKTWIIVSNEIMNTVLVQSPLNEEYVAVKKIQKLLDEGHTEKEVALIWNGSLGGTEKPVEKRGVNWKGQKYDTKVYSQLVLTAYAQQ